jgi:hypothetical protein
MQFPVLGKPSIRAKLTIKAFSRALIKGATPFLREAVVFFPAGVGSIPHRNIGAG